MTVIQTVVGGTGGVTIDLSQPIVLNNIPWTSSSKTLYVIVKDNDTSDQPTTADVSITDGLKCKVSYASRVRRLDSRQTVALSDIQTNIQTAMNNSSLTQLPDGDYEISVSTDYGEGTPIAIINNGTYGTASMGRIGIAISNGSVTVTTMNGTGYAASNSSAATLTICIYNVVKTNRSDAL